MVHDVMLSHYPGDKAVANKICSFLEAKGMSTWFGPRDNKGGEPIEQASLRAVEDATVVLLVLSTNASSSPQIHAEVQAAHELGKPIAALIGDLVRLPGQLHSYITHPVHIQQAGKVFRSDLEGVVAAAELAVEEGLASATNADETDPYGSFNDDDVALGGIGGGSGLLELTSDDISDDDDVPPPAPAQHRAHAASDRSDAYRAVPSSYADEPPAHEHDDDDLYGDIFGDDDDVYEPTLTPDVPPDATPDACPPTGRGSSAGAGDDYAPAQGAAARAQPGGQSAYTRQSPGQPSQAGQGAGHGAGFGDRRESNLGDRRTPSQGDRRGAARPAPPARFEDFDEAPVSDPGDAPAPPPPPPHPRRTGLFGAIRRLFSRG